VARLGIAPHASIRQSPLRYSREAYRAGYPEGTNRHTIIAVDSNQGANRRADYFSYATPLGWEFPATILTIMFAGGLIGLVASAVTGGPWAFLLVFLCVVAYMAYGFLYHRAYVVRVTDGVLSWHGCRYHGSRPMSDVEAVTLGTLQAYTYGCSATLAR
jgi:hypothetical protein